MTEIKKDELLKTIEDDFNKVANNRYYADKMIEKWQAIISHQIDLKSWKGKDVIGVSFNNKEWFITEHRKDKLTGEVAKNTHIIPDKNVKAVKKIIKILCKKNESTKYINIVNEIMEENGLMFDISAFNGGKNRAKYYFPLYYYPMKVLESLNFIEYGKIITRIGN